VDLGATRLIPEGPLPPGDVFTVGYDPAGARMALFRIQAVALPGSGKFQVVGVTSKSVRESARVAFDYLRGNSRRVGIERDFGSYDFNVQVMSPSHATDSADLGMSFYVAILTALASKSVQAGVVILGQMTIHGVLTRLEQLGDRLRIAMDAGARLVLIPTPNAADLGTIPGELLDKLRVEFYSDPTQALFKVILDV
jgi:ATP-dependent Lon protease